MSNPHASSRNWGRIVQFTLYADDRDKAAFFYKAVFGWAITTWEKNERWDTPMFIENAGIATGDLKGHIAKGGPQAKSMNGFEPIIAVRSLAATEMAITANGGEVLEYTPFMNGVGHLRFRDPAGNVLQAFQFNAERRISRKATSNKRMQLTRSAKANGRRGPRS